jgi:CheY-like chemotaxis protein
LSKIVLCVDDSATMQMVADITFRGTDFTYVGARSADEALDKARSHKPTIVLADSQMPGKTGYDLCMAMKSDGKLADIPVVILVGNGAPYDANRGVTVGADANLPKPWDTQTMLEKVSEVVTKAAGGVAKPGQAVAVAAAATPTPVPIASVAKAAPAPAAAAAAGAMPPRSATIMGMPTIKMPAGVAQPAPAPAKTTVMAVPPISPTGGLTPASPGLRPPAPAVAAVAAAAATPAPVAPMPATTVAGVGGVARPPMVAGTPTKRSALVERTLAKMAARLAEAAGLEPGSPELVALLKLSTEVVERIVWEVVPDLAEQIIRENLHDLTARRS